MSNEALLVTFTDQQLVGELQRRGAVPRCPCGRWSSFVGPWDRDGVTLRCHGCLKAHAKCTCR